MRKSCVIPLLCVIAPVVGALQLQLALVDSVRARFLLLSAQSEDAEHQLKARH